MPILWALDSLCIWRTVQDDWHGVSVMKMKGVEPGHEVEADNEEVHKSF